jgi:dihydrofolate reductase
MGMAKLVFGMNQSLDGYVDHLKFAPSATLFRHFIEEAQQQAGSVYGRKIYEIMRYWDDDHPEWDEDRHAFAAAWRKQPKWVVSRTLTSVGPNATLVQGDLEGAIRALKAERDGEIEVAGPNLARSLTELGLIDEYRIYLHPVVLGNGTPYFASRSDWRGCDQVDLRSCLIPRKPGGTRLTAGFDGGGVGHAEAFAGGGGGDAGVDGGDDLDQRIQRVFVDSGGAGFLDAVAGADLTAARHRHR